MRISKLHDNGKPRLREWRGQWVCYYDYRMSTGRWLGRVNGMGFTPEAAYADFRKLDRDEDYSGPLRA